MSSSQLLRPFEWLIQNKSLLFRLKDIDYWIALHSIAINHQNPELQSITDDKIEIEEKDEPVSSIPINKEPQKSPKKIEEQKRDQVDRLDRDRREEQHQRPLGPRE